MENIASHYDVIVAGGGPGGFPAAIAAARAGRSVLLIERDGFPGGVAVSGLPLLGFLDHTGRQVVGGIAQELIDALAAHGATSGHVPCPVHNSVTAVNGSWVRLEVLDMLIRAGVHMLFHTALTGVAVEKGRVTGVTAMAHGAQYHFACGALIDATGDGDGACYAGATFEKSALLQPASLMFNVGNVDLDQVYDYIEAHPHTVSLPNTFRTHTFDYKSFRRSAGYVFIGFPEFMRRAAEEGVLTALDKQYLAFIPTTNPGEVCLNMTRALNVDGTDALSLTRGAIACHRQIGQLMDAMRKYCPGFAHCFLASIAPSCGVRETRRIKGAARLARQDLATLAVPEDSVALAGYIVDIHAGDGMETYYEQTSRALGIPYGCLLPRGVEGLLVSGRAISVDDYAFGMTRAMATCMAVGQAAGEAAAMAVEGGLAPSQIDGRALAKRLRSNGAIL